MQLTLEIDYDPTINVTVIGLNICIIFILSARKEQENLVDNHRCHDGLRHRELKLDGAIGHFAEPL